MTTTAQTSPEELRAQMVAAVRDEGHVRTERLQQALNTVPRHAFVPDASLEEAYHPHRAITIKDGGPNGQPASCSTWPTVIAMMLDQLDVQPGEHVLEIGAGTGYNAALLTELVGAEGSVTTIDIHPDVTDHAQRCLNNTGYTQVRVITGDGARGVPEHAPYDKIIVTVGPWDIPPAWIDQLKSDGRLVVPLHWRGQARSISFTHARNGTLVSEDCQLCGFIPMIGIVPSGERAVELHSEVALHLDRDQDVAAEALHEALMKPATKEWSGVTVRSGESFDGIWLRLTATEPGTCRIAATPQAKADGVCSPVLPYRSPAVVDNDSFAYLTARQADGDGEQRFELGAAGHGPTGSELAERLCQHIRDWNRDRTAQPRILAAPYAFLENDLPDGLIITKHHVRLVLA
ncbi:hypothetical protein GCM10022247_35970 [Allokutzneria multivorans]|uniref:Protein-L-isoaspartate O-methyltransferase n=1 Tax=Allokutzneria multivorans TaxID=1142134 RepID=A0ABP7SE30_9PSEU